MDGDAVVGVTSNPTIFQKAISQGSAYDDQLRELLDERCETVDAFFRLAERDVGDACDLLHGVWEETAGRDGYVSIEVDPNLAYEREATFKQATELHDRINKPNLLVKIPGTEPGLGAIEDSIAAGRSINITLLFSLSRHKEVIEAYQRGIERLIESGGDPSRVASVASYFVSRVDTEADKRLDEIGSESALALRGKLAIANAKLAYQTYLEEFSTDRWKALEEKGATRQRCLWASTSAKNPEYRDTLYVEELIGPETVNTMPEETIQAFQDHGRVAETLTQGVDEAKRVFEQVAEVGVDYDDVTAVLEKEGVEKFSDSFSELLEGIKAKRGALVSA
jgi:transaldolase